MHIDPLAIRVQVLVLSPSYVPVAALMKASRPRLRPSLRI